MKKKHLFFLIIVLFTACKTSQKNNLFIPLSFEWEFEYNSNWYKATVPGCIHTDLMDNNFIDNPFYRNNEESIQWIAERNWKYRTHFAKKDVIDCNNAELVLEGLDSYAEIFLNGIPLIHTNGSNITDNMFRKWVFPLDIEKLQEHNELLIIFSPTKLMDMEKSENYQYKLQDIRALTRKSPYQSGWDWGPTLITCGIWQPAYIIGWNEIKITDYQIYQKEIKENAIIEVETSFELAENCNTQLEYFIDDILVHTTPNKQYEKGTHTIRQDLTIHMPLLWHPNGMGDQNMYTIKVIVKTPHTFETNSHKIGLRTVELIQEKDSVGRSFTFYVNGKPMFMKGANWIPAESFPTEMTYEKYHNLIKSMKDSHMNMIRIWGGGHYENDHFYELCDEMGILVWQDFIFAGALYPEEKEFHDNIAMEAKEQIKRLRNHACIAVWCGNNEVKNAWEDWGWQKEYSEEEKVLIGNNINTIFDSLLACAVKQYDPEHPYLPTSPLWGWGHPENFTEGDSHYWGVWWGELPFEVWEKSTGRFMSEYGFQSYPELASIKQFTIPEDRVLNSSVMRNHQKHSRGVEIITKSMNQYFGQTSDFENFIYLSQLVQAYGVGEAIEIHRRKMPYCMGSLYWQLNDCWPVASWSSIDYYGNKKALYYTSVEKFAPLMISTKENVNRDIELWVISDLFSETKGSLSFELIDFSGNILDKQEIENIVIKENTSSFISLYSIPEKINLSKSEVLLAVTFKDQNGITARKIHYFVYPKELKLKEAKIVQEVTNENGIFVIRLRSGSLAKGVFLYTDDDFAGTYSDNYFDLLPGEEKIIKYTPSTKELDRAYFNIKTYNSLSEVKK